jgi:hypothetical protein
MNLGITRQSAWERWRELDEQPAEPAEQALATAAQHLAASATSAVAVPDVIGLGVDDAGRVLHDAGFVAGEHNPGGPITPLRAGQGSTVVDQVPRGGARRRRGSTVALWLERGGGGAGVREPRRPKPDPRAAREVRDIG